MIDHITRALRSDEHRTLAAIQSAAYKSWRFALTEVLREKVNHAGLRDEAAMSAVEQLDEACRAIAGPASGTWVPIQSLARDLWTSNASAAVGNNMHVAAALAPASTIIAVGATVVAVLQEGELRLPLFERCAHESSQVVIGFKPIAAQVEVSAKLLESERQDVELEIRRLLLESFVAELDRVAIAGLLNNPDVPVVVGGANGAALTWDNIVALEHTVASNGGDIKSGAFLMSPNVLRALRTTQRGKGQDFIMGSDLQLLGHPVHVSQHVPRAIAFGRWADLLVVLRGPAALDVVVDTKTRAADGVLLVTAKADCGVAPLRAASFAKMTDVVTS